MRTTGVATVRNPGDRSRESNREFDAILLNQLGFPAMGVPGVATWQDKWDGYVSMVDNVYVLFDSDEAGIKGSARMRERFGAKIRELHLPEENGELPDITDWIVRFGRGPDDIRALIDEARGGSYLVTVDQAFTEHQEVQGATGLQFGIEKLDHILRPGLLHNQVMVVTARTEIAPASARTEGHGPFISAFHQQSPNPGGDSRGCSVHGGAHLGGLASALGTRTGASVDHQHQRHRHRDRGRAGMVFPPFPADLRRSAVGHRRPRASSLGSEALRA